MQPALTAAHWCAVEILQTIRDRHQPGTFEFEIADHAIDLVISGTRPAGPFLLSNAYRDARSVLIRRKRRGREFLPIDEEAIESREGGASTLAWSAPVCPDRRVMFLDGYECLKAHLERGNNFATRCLERWWLGDTLEETADSLGISREYAKKLRGAIRRTANSRLPEFRSAA